MRIRPIDFSARPLLVVLGLLAGATPAAAGARAVSAASQATAAAPIPLDANGLPLWEVRLFDDFPVRIELKGREELDELLKQVPIASFHREQVSIVRETAGSFRVVLEPRVTSAEAQALTQAGYPYERIPDRERETCEEMERIWAEQAREGGETFRFGAQGTYHTHAQIGAILQQTEIDHPDLAEFFIWGYSVLGRELWGIKISDNVGTEEAEPEVRLASTMHGNEPPGMEMLLYLVNHLTDNYPVDPDVTYLVDNYEIHIMPLINPDGYVTRSRYNANWVDLNRNYPVPDGSIGGDGTYSEEVETVAFKSYGFTHNFVISENGHSGALVVNYPWDYQYPLIPDNDATVQMSLEYSQYNQPMYNGPFPQGITNGAQWYIVKGSLQDWSYEETGCIDVTIEYSNSYRPPVAALDSLWENDNKESFMHWILSARYGVSGVVTGLDTALPLSAMVTVAGNSKPVFTDRDLGDYYKLLDTGTYDITFSSPGYLDDTVYGVSVVWGTPTVVNVALVPESSTDVALGTPAEIRLVGNSPNPFNPETFVHYELPGRGRVSLRIFDVQGRLVRILLEDAESDVGRHAVMWDGKNDRRHDVASGAYFCQMSAGSYLGMLRIVLIR